MRAHLHVFELETFEYSRPEHSKLFQTMRKSRRDHYHLREGYKLDMPFICLIKADLSSPNAFIKGEIGGRDDDFSRKNELLHIRFEVFADDKDKVFIAINSSDRITSYEQSIQLVKYCMQKMFQSCDDLLKSSSGGNNKNKIGYYPQSAQYTGMFSTFDENFSNAVSELVLPEEFRPFFREANYNLQRLNMKSKKKTIHSTPESTL